MTDEKSIHHGSTITEAKRRLNVAYIGRELKVKQLAFHYKFRDKNTDETILVYANELKNFLEEQKPSAADGISICSELIKKITEIENKYQDAISKEENNGEGYLELVTREIESLNAQMSQEASKILAKKGDERLEKAKTSNEGFYDSAIKLLSSDPVHFDARLKNSNLFVGETKNQLGGSEFAELASYTSQLRLGDRTNDGALKILINSKDSHYRAYRLETTTNLVLKTHTLTIPQQIALGLFVYEFGGVLGMNRNEVQGMDMEDDEELAEILREKNRLTGDVHSNFVQFLVIKAAKESGGSIFSKGTIRFDRNFVQQLKPLLKIAVGPKETWNKTPIKDEGKKLKKLEQLRQAVDAKKPPEEKDKIAYTRALTEINAERVFATYEEKKYKATLVRTAFLVGMAVIFPLLLLFPVAPLALVTFSIASLAAFLLAPLVASLIPNNWNNITKAVLIAASVIIPLALGVLFSLAFPALFIAPVVPIIVAAAGSFLLGIGAVVSTLFSPMEIDKKVGLSVGILAVATAVALGLLIFAPVVPLLLAGASLFIKVLTIAVTSLLLPAVGVMAINPWGEKPFFELGSANSAANKSALNFEHARLTPPALQSGFVPGPAQVQVMRQTSTYNRYAAEYDKNFGKEDATPMVAAGGPGKL